MASSSPAPAHPHPAFGVQLRYLIEWFSEYSALQKNDFLIILCDQFGARNQVNGQPPIRSEDAQPEGQSGPSIFQVRVRLFLAWSCDWNNDQIYRFIDSLRAVDSDFVDNFVNACPSYRRPEQQDGNEGGDNPEAD